MNVTPVYSYSHILFKQATIIKLSIDLQKPSECAKKYPKQGQSTHNQLFVGSIPNGPLYQKVASL